VLLLTMILSIVALPRIIGTTVHSVGLQWHALMQQAHAGHAAGVGVKLLAIVALVVPVGGILYLIARMARSYGMKIWRGTQGKPGKRVLAGVVTAAMLGGLAYAWFPRTGTYRPIEPWEGGRVQDAVSASPLHALMPAFGTQGTQDSGLQVGEQRNAQTIWPAGAALPTADHPQIALVLTPKDAGSDLPTWVFPFNRPAPPRPGDNQALSIVTQDGGTAYHAAFALVWADGDTVNNTNSAYALASCAKCMAVAIAFQVVVVVGDAHVVAPENIAAAVNYNCISCVTAALAVQLVLQVPDQLSDQAMAELTKLWAQIMSWSAHLEDLTFAQIRDQIQQFEAQIIAIVKPELIAENMSSASPTPGADPSATTDPAGTSAPAVDPSASPTGGASSTSSPAPADTGSTSGTSQPSPSPSSSAAAPQPTG